MTTKKWIRNYCRRESASIRKIEIPDWQEAGNTENIARMQPRLGKIADIRSFLRRYPHEELDFKRFPCANGTEILAAILGYRDAWDAALATQRNEGMNQVKFCKIHHAMNPELKKQVGKTGEIMSEVSVAGLEKKYLVQFPSDRPAANRFWLKARYLEIPEAVEGKE